MKFMVFEYYNEFYKNVYDEKAYEKKRLSVYRFFLDAASDGTVPPTLLPGAKSSAQSASRSVLPRSPEEGILSEFYRSRKLFDRCLEAIALRNDLTLGELSLLLSLSQMHTFAAARNLPILPDYPKARSRAPCKSFPPKIISASSVPENTCTWICFRQRPRSSRSSPPHKTILMRHALPD